MQSCAIGLVKEGLWGAVHVPLKKRQREESVMLQMHQEVG